MPAVEQKGIRVAGPLVTLAAAGVANTGNLWQISAFAQRVGVTTARIKRLKVVNYSGVSTWLYIGTGTGVGFVQAMPRLRLLNGVNDDYAENDLPEVEFSANITCYVDNATCEVQAEIEEVG